MAHDIFPTTTSCSHASLNSRRLRSFLRSNKALQIGFLSTPFLLTGLVVYLTFFSPQTPLWRLSDRNHPFPPPPLQSPSSVSDVLTLEQIRDVVAPTRGFFSRDYSMYLGWNNMRHIIEAALLQAELLNRTLVIPSFVYARTCVYNITVCAAHVPMVNLREATRSDRWHEQMGFRIPISVIVNMTHLRSRQPVITTSEYLRLHGQSPESESTSGFWLRQSYHTHPNVFESNNMKTPSLFVIKNHWYDPAGTNRVDYIPEAMKRRGNLKRHLGPADVDTEYWPPLKPTGLSNSLIEAMRWQNSAIDWYAARHVVESSHLGRKVNLDDDKAIEELLNVHGWEVLHTFPVVLDADFAKTIVGHVKEVVPRSSIRGFRDDYHDVNADVIVLAGETHLGTKPGAMRFTEDLSRKRYVSNAVHSLIPPQKALDLAEDLSSRMRLRTKGRLWRGAHVRRGDFLQMGWTRDTDPAVHIRHVKERLQAGCFLLADLHDRGNLTTCDIEGAQPDLEPTLFPPPRAEDPFFVATDERDPDALRKFSEAGAVFMSDLLTIEDRRAFGWPLMLSDVRAIVELQVLVHSGFFYGRGLSSFAGSVVNLRAARGADPRTMILE